MRKTSLIISFLLALLTGPWCAAEQSASPAMSAPDLLKQIQVTYACGGFSARFEQASTLKAMDITDTASGRAYFVEPGMMRWEYIEPEPQQIITDGKKLWIYKPLENQVMTGDVSSMFEDGQGVSLLAALRTIEKQNQVSIDRERVKKGYSTLKVVPDKKTLDLAAVFFYVSQKTGLIEEIETINIYNDTTRIMFSDIHLGDSFDAALFNFKPPKDADVLLLNPNE